MKKQLKLVLLGLVVAIMACLIEPFIGQAEITGTVVNNNSETVINSKNEINYQPQIAIPGFKTENLFKNNNTTSPIAELIKALYAYGVKIVTLIALVVVIIGGFMWSTAGGSKQKVGEAQQWIKSGISGLLLILFAYVILRTINVRLVDLETNEIASVSPITIEGKSDQKQAAEDYSFFDRYYSFPPIGNNPTLEACCISYNDNLFTSDKIHFASILYSPKTIAEANQKCHKFTADLYGAKENKVDVFDFQGWNTNSPSWSSSWVKSNYENSCGDICYGVIEGFACWSPQAGSYINENSKGKNAANFCQGRGDGTSCILTSADNKRKWGYCQSGDCKACADYNASCSQDYQCPDEDKAIGKSSWVINWKCGDKEGGVDGDCSGGKCSCNHDKCK